MCVSLRLGYLSFTFKVLKLLKGYTREACLYNMHGSMVGAWPECQLVHDVVFGEVVITFSVKDDMEKGLRVLNLAEEVVDCLFMLPEGAISNGI